MNTLRDGWDHGCFRSVNRGNFNCGKLNWVELIILVLIYISERIPNLKRHNDFVPIQLNQRYFTNDYIVTDSSIAIFGLSPAHLWRLRLRHRWLHLPWCAAGKRRWLRRGGNGWITWRGTRHRGC